jgi:hypothetical protein
VSTSGSGGKKLKKKVTVITDDPNNRQIPLIIQGRVLEFYTLSPKSVILKGIAGETIRETIRLVPNRDYPFTVKKVTAKQGKNIRFELAEVEDGENIEYDLTVENIAADPGDYFDTLYLTTDSDIKSQIRVLVSASIEASKSETTGEKRRPKAAGTD